MNLLVDTHVLIWILNNSSELQQKQYDVLEQLDNIVFASAVSIFEITTKARIGKLQMPENYLSNVSKIFQEFRYQPLNITPAHADLAGRLVGDHKDPFDRLLAAQSIVEDMPIMTVDTRIGDFGARVIW